MKDRALGGVAKGLYNGSRISTTSYYRHDKRIFAKKNSPTEIEKLSIALVVDESGSMMRDYKIDVARLFSLILYDVCSNLDIELMIIGHTDCTFGNSYDDKDKYRIMGMSARGGDSAFAAFRMGCEAIKNKTIAENKLLIMVSDGLPNHDESQLRELAKKAKFQKINVIAASIGCDIDRMKSIYGDNTLDIENVNMLPKTLMNCIKRYLD